MLREKLSDYNVILASGSPRRQNFFKELDIPFKIDVRPVEEIYPDHLKGAQITEYLAELKSDAFQDLKENEIVITSDTIVWFEDKALGKPKDYKEAFEMIKSMSGKPHKVYTSIFIKSKRFRKVFYDKTEVWFKELTESEIEYYLTTCKPYDKAGGYGIQEWIGLIGIEKIQGSYFNVVGLPVHKLYKELISIDEL